MLNTNGWPIHTTSTSNNLWSYDCIKVGKPDGLPVKYISEMVEDKNQYETILPSYKTIQESRLVHRGYGNITMPYKKQT